MNKIAGFISKLALFIGLFFLAFHVSPYLITNKYYQQGQQVDANFPLLIEQNQEIKIITWQQYQANTKVKLVNREIINGKLPYQEHFDLQVSPNGHVDLTYYADNYTYWSGYEIKDGQAIASYFRFNGAFIVMPIFAVLIVLWLAIDLWMFYSKRRSNNNPT